MGAGFSKWCINLPLVNELFDFQGNFWTQESRKIEKLERVYINWKKKNISKTNEHFIAEVLNPENGSLNRFSDELLFYISRRLTEPFIFYEQHLGAYFTHPLPIANGYRSGI